MHNTFNLLQKKIRSQIGDFLEMTSNFKVSPQSVCFPKACFATPIPQTYPPTPHGYFSNILLLLSSRFACSPLLFLDGKSHANGRLILDIICHSHCLRKRNYLKVLTHSERHQKQNEVMPIFLSLQPLALNNYNRNC